MRAGEAPKFHSNQVTPSSPLRHLGLGLQATLGHDLFISLGPPIPRPSPSYRYSQKCRQPRTSDTRSKHSNTRYQLSLPGIPAAKQALAVHATAILLCPGVSICHTYCFEVNTYERISCSLTPLPSVQVCRLMKMSTIVNNSSKTRRSLLDS